MASPSQKHHARREGFLSAVKRPLVAVMLGLILLTPSLAFTKSDYIQLIENHADFQSWQIYRVCNPAPKALSVNSSQALSFAQVLLRGKLDGYRIQWRKVGSLAWADLSTFPKTLPLLTCYEIKLSASVKNGTSVDIIPSFAGYNFPEYAWWNVSWGKAFPIYYSSNNGTSLSDWAICANVSRGVFTDLQPDFSDLRVTEDNLTLRNFGFLNSSAGNWAMLCLNASSVPSGSNGTAWIYYQNLSGPVTSPANLSKTNVFAWYDDASVDSIADYTKYSSFTSSTLSWNNSYFEHYDFSATGNWQGYYVSGGVPFSNVQMNITLYAAPAPAGSYWFGTNYRSGTTGNDYQECVANPYGSGADAPRTGNHVGGVESWTNTSLNAKIPQSTVFVMSGSIDNSSIVCTQTNNTGSWTVTATDSSLSGDGTYPYYGLGQAPAGQVYRILRIVAAKYSANAPSVYFGTSILPPGDSNPPIIEYYTPDNFATVAQDDDVNFTSWIQDDLSSIANWTLWTNESAWGIVASNQSPVTNATNNTISYAFIQPGIYKWSQQACDSIGNCAYGHGGEDIFYNRTIIVVESTTTTTIPATTAEAISRGSFWLASSIFFLGLVLLFLFMKRR